MTFGQGQRIDIDLTFDALLTSFTYLFESLAKAAIVQKKIIVIFLIQKPK